MSLPRWTLFIPLGALVVTGVGTRVASCAHSRAKTSAAGVKTEAAKVQPPRVFDPPPPSDAARKPTDAQAVETATRLFFAAPNRFTLLPSDFAAFQETSQNLFQVRVGGDGSAGMETTGQAEALNMPHSGKKRKRVASLALVSGSGENTAAHWKSPHYESWKPTAIYGPPLSCERESAQQQAHRLLQDLQAGRLSVMINERDGEQIRSLEREGVYCWPAPPAGVSLRTPRQRAALEGIREDPQGAGSQHAARMQLASRGGAERTATFANPADDPDFDPCVCLPAPALLRMLTALAAHSTSARPLEVMSLLRPPYRFGDYVHVGLANPHSLGLAVDIAAYGGHPIRQSDPEGCVAATIALLRDLPPGRYRLGMPKAPEGGWSLPPGLLALLQSGDETTTNLESETKQGKAAKAAHSGGAKTIQFDPSDSSAAASEAGNIPVRTGCAIAALYGLHVSAAKPAWPFFPSPYLAIIDTSEASAESASVASHSARASTAKNEKRQSASDSPAPHAVQTALRFQNEAYAPESALADLRLRNALEAARRRGANVVAMFPDGADHLHVDVRQNP